MEKLIVIMLFVGVFTQSIFAEYRHSSLKSRCEFGQINGKYQGGGAWDAKVCLQAIHVVANDKSIIPYSRYLQAKKIAEKVCRKHGDSSLEGRKACQLHKYYRKKFRQHNKSRPDRKW